jgi:hypothetical protein
MLTESTGRKVGNGIQITTKAM